MLPYSVAFLVYGASSSGRDALTEEKYKDLAGAFLSAGFTVKSVLYHEESVENLYESLLHFDAVLVWVNPLEQGKDRRRLDEILVQIAGKGCLVSAHPDIILKMGTKDILFKTKDMDWGGDIKLYAGFDDFVDRFPESLKQSGVKILKQYRGNGGNGVFKVVLGLAGREVTVVHASKSNEATVFSWRNFFDAFRPYFFDGGLLIEQPWNANHANGMVRCYVCGNRVAGFGYQEINALYEITTADGTLHLPPGKRYYFTENCGLFADLKLIMESGWIPGLQQAQSIPDDLLPVIWDADFFINDVQHPTPAGKYSLCEINVSCVSPFPPSAARFMVKAVSDLIQKKKTAVL